MGKKSKSQSQSTSTTTSTPTNPEWVTQGVQGLSTKVMDLLGRDPKSFVAGPSALQTKAWGDAQNLTSSPFFGQAGNIFKDVAGAGANTYDSTGYDPTDATSQGYDAVNWTGQGYDATKANASTYNASSLLDGLDKYMSPYTNDVVNTALSDYDYGAGQTRANQALDEARSGAFGGSGAAITRALTEDNLTRGRGTLSAGLRDQAFGRGAALSAQDAGFRNDAARYNADANTRVSMSNADAANAAAAFGANARNTSSAANASARNAALAFGADAANRAGLANADARNTASRFGADARNTAAQYNAGAQDTMLARQLAAGGALASLGDTMGADQRANLALMGSMGKDQQALDQAKAAADINVLSDLAGIYSGLPLNLFNGNTTTGNTTSSSTSKSWDPLGVLDTVLGGVSKGAQAATAIKSLALSDRRLKTDVEKLGERPDGLGVYAFRYLWSPVRHIGVMAQEVLGVKPEAVVHLPGGYMAVNYGAL